MQFLLCITTYYKRIRYLYMLIHNRKEVDVNKHIRANIFLEIRGISERDFKEDFLPYEFKSSDLTR